jgi:hypothetical protein
LGGGTEELHCRVAGGKQAAQGEHA